MTRDILEVPSGTWTISTIMSPPPTLTAEVRANDEVLFQELHGEGVLLNLKTGVYFGLDPVGARIW